MEGKTRWEEQQLRGSLLCRLQDGRYVVIHAKSIHYVKKDAVIGHVILVVAFIACSI